MYRYTAPPAAADGFRRDAPTWLAYGALVSYAFWLYAFGPALALLREQLHFSFTVLGVYSAVWSVGAALAGAGFAPLARRLSRATLLWSAALVAAFGAALFALGSGVVATLVGAGVLGLAGTTLLTVTQAVLSDRHGPRRDRALTEANVGAAVCAVLAPLSLGAFAATPGGWQVTFWLPVAALAAMLLLRRRVPLPAPAARRDDGGAAGRLPTACRLLVLLVAAGIALEFCVIYFGAELLVQTGLSTAVAATALSCYYVGILAGRLGGAGLTRRPGRTVPLLYASLLLTAAGFVVFWLARQPVLAVLGVTVCGVGIANLYPLSLSLTLGAARGEEDRANARTQLVGGLFVVVAPYALGGLADHVGLRPAFAIEPALIIVSLVLLRLGTAVARRAAPVEQPAQLPV